MKNVCIKTGKTTITVKEYLLDLFAEKRHGGSYAEHKREVNKFIRELVSKDASDSKYVSQMVTMQLTKIVASLRGVNNL